MGSFRLLQKEFKSFCSQKFYTVLSHKMGSKFIFNLNNKSNTSKIMGSCRLLQKGVRIYFLIKKIKILYRLKLQKGFKIIF